MSTGRSVLAIARADFLERVRRYSFLVTLMAAVYLGYAAATGKIVVALGNYRGVYTSGWIGVMVALVTTTFASWIGFYIVKNVVDRDRQTGVGEILAATPLSKTAYTLGKVISNFLVLAAIVLVLALAAIVMMLFVREDPHVDLWALFSPFLLIALPALALTAAMAILFEMIPFLRTAFGNVLWFFVWSFGIALPIATKARWLDPAGIETVGRSMTEAARRVIPGYTEGFSLTIGGRQVVLAPSLRWPGVHWTLTQILLRLAWVVVALAVAVLAAAFFDRFDPARRRRFALPARSNRSTADAQPVRLQSATPTHVTSLSPVLRSGGFARLVVAELRLGLKGLPWWWYVVALGLLIAQFASSLDASRGPVLATAWIWPLTVWSAMGTRESRYGTGALLFSSARIVPRQLLAAFLAGVVVAVVIGAGAAVRLLFAGALTGLLAWFAGVLFIPALALCLGVWTRTTKAFEGLMAALWYVGPLNHVPGFDYTGSADGPETLRYAVIYVALAGTLLVAALARRKTELQHA